MTKQEAVIILENSTLIAKKGFSVSQEVLTAAYIEALATLYEAAECENPVNKKHQGNRESKDEGSPGEY